MEHVLLMGQQSTRTRGRVMLTAIKEDSTDVREPTRPVRLLTALQYFIGRGLRITQQVSAGQGLYQVRLEAAPGSSVQAPET